MDSKGPIYRNLVSTIDINRSIDSIEYINFRDINNEFIFREFLSDINSSNDVIELSLINNKAYKESVIMSLNRNISRNTTLIDMIKEEQKTIQETAWAVGYESLGSFSN